MAFNGVRVVANIGFDSNHISDCQNTPFALETRKRLTNWVIKSNSIVADLKDLVHYGSLSSSN